MAIAEQTQTETEAVPLNENEKVPELLRTVGAAALSVICVGETADLFHDGAPTLSKIGSAGAALASLAVTRYFWRRLVH
jgi:hypothetical protein